MIAELGKQRLVCLDMTGDHFLSPSKMTEGQLRKALKDRQLLPSGRNLKKEDLQKALKAGLIRILQMTMIYRVGSILLEF